MQIYHANLIAKNKLQQAQQNEHLPTSTQPLNTHKPIIAK